MLEALDVAKSSRVLKSGAGDGYTPTPVTVDGYRRPAP
jgi:protein-L-isoaspartate O-methyltransferase